MKKFRSYVGIDLRLFDGDGGGAGGAADGSSPTNANGMGAEAALASNQSRKSKNPLANVKYGKQPEAGQAVDQKAAKAPTKDDQKATNDDARRATFEAMISGEYKDLFGERTQKIIDTRFKEVKTLENRVNALKPVLEILGTKYGVDPNDAEALSKAIQEDNSYFEDEAMEKGLTVEQLKYMKKIERENAEFKRAQEAQERQRSANEIYAKWAQQAEATKQLYPNFDLQAECNHPETGERFINLLKSGVDVKAAYQVIHMDDVLGGAMAYTAQTVQQKTVNDIRARGMRPAENGIAGGSQAVVVKNDVTKLTRKDREEIARRSAKGETIIF